MTNDDQQAPVASCLHQRLIDSAGQWVVRPAAADNGSLVRKNRAAGLSPAPLPLCAIFRAAEGSAGKRLVYVTDMCSLRYGHRCNGACWRWDLQTGAGAAPACQRCTDALTWPQPAAGGWAWRPPTCGKSRTGPGGNPEPATGASLHTAISLPRRQAWARPPMIGQAADDRINGADEAPPRRGAGSVRVCARPTLLKPAQSCSAELAA